MHQLVDELRVNNYPKEEEKKNIFILLKLF